MLDLLKANEFRRYSDNIELLRQEIEAEESSGEGSQIVIDEIQKVPALLLYHQFLPITTAK